ncbi:serine--tRNA ligase [bacterium]|nr:serine--tRNA ligase [bacterium]
MLDLRLIREHPEKVKAGTAAQNVDVDIDRLLLLDEERRQYIQKGDELKAERNKASAAIGKAKKAGEDASEAIAAMKQVNDDIKVTDDTLKDILEKMRDIQIKIPNLPHPTVPVGGEENNIQVRTWGEIPTYNFEVENHADLGPRLGILDFDRGARLSGSNFVTFRGAGAALERALISFMIDMHVEKHGYTEVSVPFLVRREMMFGTGQLPKMEDDMYHVTEDDLFLIPTAEVPVTNLHREEMLTMESLPTKYVAYTPCFRREAGSYGADTRGLMRIHQFDKVEMVNLVDPETSYEVLEMLVNEAEDVLKALELPYRVLTLATGDLSFAAAKCYDLEVWAPAQDRWLEVSSCSNFEDFQARRMNMRFRREKGAKPEFIHTLNGSGLALPRTVIAILENYQTDEGTVIVPEVLRKYMGTNIIK